MGRPGSQRFCTACGHPLMEGAAFCMQCGAAVPAPRKSSYRVFKVLVPVWLVLLVVSAGIGWGSGMLDATVHSEDLEGTYAGLAIERYGQPQAFWLTDGPGTPGEKDYVRLEQWFYPDQGIILNFYDGHRHRDRGHADERRGHGSGRQRSVRCAIESHVELAQGVFRRVPDR